jgi:hypothetical protein
MMDEAFRDALKEEETLRAKVSVLRHIINNTEDEFTQLDVSSYTVTLY